VFKAHRLCVSINSGLESNAEEEGQVWGVRYTDQGLGIGVYLAPNPLPLTSDPEPLSPILSLTSSHLRSMDPLNQPNTTQSLLLLYYSRPRVE
jgi:hypothetical protein